MESRVISIATGCGDILESTRVLSIIKTAPGHISTINKQLWKTQLSIKKEGFPLSVKYEIRI